MLVRFGALAVVGGLGLGALLRVLLGRRRYPLLAALAHLPLLAHVLAAARGAWVDGVELGGVGAFLAMGVLLAGGGALLAARSTEARPWLAALAPGLAGVAYLVPFLVLERAASLAVGAGRPPLTSYGSFFLLLATVLVVCVLLPFAPRAGAARRW